MEDKYGVIAFTGDPNSEAGIVVHWFFGCKQKPDKEIMRFLHEDISTNPEFELIGVDFQLAEATPEMINRYYKSIDNEQIENS